MSCCSEAKLREHFDKHAGADGTLSIEELRKMFEEETRCKLLEGKCLEGMSTKLFEKLDGDKNGQLTWEEFKEIAVEMKQCKDKMQQMRGQQMRGQQ